MPRIIAIDYGGKRSGLAWTDPLQIIATALETVATGDLLARLKQLVAKEEVEGFLLGLPARLDGSDTHMSQPVREFRKKLEKTFPGLPVTFWDEQFTSRMAGQALIEAGVSKKKRRQKGILDRVSATLILQEYLASQR